MLDSIESTQDQCNWVTGTDFSTCADDCESDIQIELEFYDYMCTGCLAEDASGEMGTCEEWLDFGGDDECNNCHDDCYENGDTPECHDMCNYNYCGDEGGDECWESDHFTSYDPTIPTPGDCHALAESEGVGYEGCYNDAAQFCINPGCHYNSDGNYYEWQDNDGQCCEAYGDCGNDGDDGDDGDDDGDDGDDGFNVFDGDDDADDGDYGDDADDRNDCDDDNDHHHHHHYHHD
jgi:hypothetical protein